jgi:hypothetical protein
LCYLYTKSIRIRPPVRKRVGDDVTVLLLASTAGTELLGDVVRRHARAFPLASKASQEKTLPAASALQQVIHCLSFIKGSVIPLLRSPLRPPEKKRKEERP